MSTGYKKSISRRLGGPFRTLLSPEWTNTIFGPCGSNVRRSNSPRNSNKYCVVTAPVPISRSNKSQAFRLHIKTVRLPGKCGVVNRTVVYSLCFKRKHQG